MLGVLDERKIVARRADLHSVPDAHLVEDVARAAAALRIALDADDVGFGIVGRIEQRELADEPVGRCEYRCARPACRAATRRRRGGQTRTDWYRGRRPLCRSAAPRSARRRGPRRTPVPRPRAMEQLPCSCGLNRRPGRGFATHSLAAFGLHARPPPSRREYAQRSDDGRRARPRRASAPYPHLHARVVTNVSMLTTPRAAKQGEHPCST